MTCTSLTVVNTHQGSLSPPSVSVKRSLRSRNLPHERLKKSGCFKHLAAQIVEVLKVCPSLEDPIRLNENDRDEEGSSTPPREKRPDLKPSNEVMDGV